MCVCCVYVCVHVYERVTLCFLFLLHHAQHSQLTHSPMCIHTYMHWVALVVVCCLCVSWARARVCVCVCECVEVDDSIDGVFTSRKYSFSHSHLLSLSRFLYHRPPLSAPMVPLTSHVPCSSTRCPPSKFMARACRFRVFCVSTRPARYSVMSVYKGDRVVIVK